MRLCFKSLSDAHQMRNCCGRLCDVNGCGKPHHRLLHRPYKNVEQKELVENVDEVSNLFSTRSSGVLPVIPVMIGSGTKTLKTFALCNFVARLSFMDESLMNTPNLTGQLVDLNVAGIHGTSDISSKRLHLSVLKHSTINLKDVKVVLAKIVITCTKQQNIEIVKTQSRGCAMAAGMDAQWTLASTSDCQTRNLKLSFCRSRSIGGSSEDSAEHGFICFQLQRIREFQGRDRERTRLIRCRKQLAGSQH